MLSGHASHQIGLDADIWLRQKTDRVLTQPEREEISSISMRRASGAYTNDRWTKDHETVLKLAASDPRVARIFIFPGAKVAMCKSARGDRSWLRKIRPWYGHHYHFHVRLRCPEGQENCIAQAPPPLGDGCKEAVGWVNRILTPPHRTRMLSHENLNRRSPWPNCPNNAARFYQTSEGPLYGNHLQYILWARIRARQN